MKRIGRLAALSLATLLLPPGQAVAADAGKRRPPVQLSSAGHQLLKDQLARDRVLPRELIEQHGLDVVDESDVAPAHEPGEAHARPFGTARAQAIHLGADVQANDRSGDVSCSACAGRPLGQAETTIAAWGPYVVAGWNDTKGFCTGLAVQGWAISSDGGATFTDMGEVPGLASGGRYRGDPVHFVDTSNGTFWILGLHEEAPATGSGLAILNGHFAGSTFIVDGNRKVLAGGADFLDKEWGAVDPASHNLYVTYSRFVGGSVSQIEFVRSTDGGATWSAPSLMHDASQNGLVQGSRPIVGPNGEVIVYWYESFTSFDSPFSRHHVRISTDGGQTFGSDVVAAPFIENFTTGGAGFRRGFAPTFASIAVDLTDGPHRGRIYLAWDESVNAYDAPAPSLGDKSEVENNNFHASATPFSIGQRLRGTLTGTATDSLDLWTFSGGTGQTVFIRTDSATANATFQLRLQCSSDTSLFQNLRFLSFNQGNSNYTVYTLPTTGSYFMRMFRSASGSASYVLSTSFDTPTAGERARDHRDQFICWSDDGVAWSSPVRVTDSAPANDGIFPEVAVDAAGRVHVYWHDWRDDVTCGAESAEYMVSSGDGGVTWGPNVRISDPESFWSINACGSANQGDYQGITTLGSDVLPCWADSRNGDADAFLERIARGASASCPGSPQLFAGGTTPFVSFTLTNSGNVETRYRYAFEDDAGWITGATPAVSGEVPLAASTGQAFQVDLALPASCAPTSSELRLLVEDLTLPGAVDTCRVTIDCGALSVEGGVAALSFARPQPNPSTGRTVFTYGLPRETRVRLAIHAADGRRVRMLREGTTGAGLHAVSWDGLDDDGRRAPPGVYWARLEAEGRHFERQVAVLH